MQSAVRERCGLPTLRRVGRGGESYVHIESLLTARQLAAAQAYVRSAEVQRALSDGILYHEDGANDENGGGGNGSSGRGETVAEAKKRQRAAARERQSAIAWLERCSENDDGRSPEAPGWLHSRLRAAARATHSVYGERFCPVGVDTAGRWTPRYEPVQYTEYGVGAHYAGWHTDAELDSEDTEDARAVTVVVLLSDTEAFAGGAFQVRVRGKVSTVPLRAGDAVCFPAKRLEHRVTKVRQGLRQSLVFWVTKPGGR